MRIVGSALEAVKVHGAEGYPLEVCGILVGSLRDGFAAEARRTHNVYGKERGRYEIDPVDHLRIQRQVENNGLDIVGYYHSHPDHPARPSRYDSERAWPGYVYLIVSISSREFVEANAFIAAGGGGFLSPEPLDIITP